MCISADDARARAYLLMPKRAPRPCRASNCPHLVTDAATEFRGFCEQCAATAAAEHSTLMRTLGSQRRERNKPSDRFYATKMWRRVSESFRKRNPLCAHCASRQRVKAADLVDHIVERSDGGDDYSVTNLQSLCHPCHNTKTASEKRKRRGDQA